MGFHEIRFPTTINWGSAGGPRFNTSISEMDSGVEERVARWQGGRRIYDAAYGIRSYQDLYSVYTFFLARIGASYGFRYKDWLDYTSTADGRLLGEGGTAAVTHNDQIIGVGDGVTASFQLIKTYSDSLVARVRNINKPVQGLTLIGLDTVNTNGVGWSVDNTTGLVLFTSIPTVGQIISSGFVYDVPVRFGESVDVGGLLTRLSDYGSGDIDSIPLIEDVNSDIVQDEYFYGGATNWGVISANQNLSVLSGRVQAFTNNTVGLKLFLPVATGLPTGGPYFFIQNNGTQSLLLRTSADTAVITIAATAIVTVILGLDSGGVNTWYAF